MQVQGGHVQLPMTLHGREPRIGQANNGGTAHVWDLAVSCKAAEESAARPALQRVIADMVR
jgi:hypothetical protein